MVSAAEAPATLLMIRHAEKATDGSPDLAEAGFARAKALPKIFLPSSLRADLATPQFLFAAASTGHSKRPVETLVPLADALHLRVDASYGDDDYAELATELLRGGYCAKVVLIAWRHKTLPQLAAALGADPPSMAWPTQQYDRIWRIDYTRGKALMRDLPFALMPGDSEK